jgi:hypothetical protein
MNPTKLLLHLFDFSVIFHAIYKNQEIPFTIGVHLLHWKDFGFRNVAPGGAACAAPVQFRRARRRTWPGKGWGRSYGLLGPVWGVGQGWNGSGERLAGGKGGAAAVVAVPARLRPMCGNR